MDIKAKIEEIIDKVKSDKGFAKKFKKDPVKAIEALIGKDLPDDQIKSVIEAVKAKVSLEKVGGFFKFLKKKSG